MIHSGAVTAGTHDVTAFFLHASINVGGQYGYMDNNGHLDSFSTLLYITAAESIQVQCRQGTGVNRTLDGVPGTYFAIESVDMNEVA